MKLSVVIPVYQVATTLPRCLDSIINQSFTDWEGILVDDCSTDGSASICDKYAKKEKRFKVIHLKQNLGLSGARNAGIAEASSTYITFVDSDDKVEPDTYRQLMNILEQHPEYDLLEYPAIEFYGHSYKQHLLSFKNKAYQDLREYWFKTKAYTHAYACNKIYKRKLFDNIQYPLNTVYEDVYVLPKLLNASKIVATTNKGLYYYYYNKNGITAKSTGKQLQQLLDAHINIMKNKEITNHPEFAVYYAHVLNIQLDVYELSGLKITLPLIKPRHGRYKTFKLMLLSIFGLKFLCRINKILHLIYKRKN